MSKINDGGPASFSPCAWCENPSHIKQGRIMLCATHYRIGSMRSRAKRDGKYVPSRAEIEKLIVEPFVCEGCGRGMNWLREQGASTQVTLQHDRSGNLRLICLGCNTRHAHHPGDLYWSLGPGQKYCGKCDRVLPETDFVKDVSRPRGLKGWCRSCSSTSVTGWQAANREHYNAKQREGRAKRKAMLAARTKGGNADG